MKAVTASLLAVSVASLAPHSVACWWPGDALKRFFGGSDGTTVPPDMVAPYESNDVLYNTTFAPPDNMMTMPQTQETTGFSLEHLMTTSDTDAVSSGTRPPDHENLGMATMVSSEAMAEATETTAQLTMKSFVTTSSTPLYDPNENDVSAFNSQLLGNSTSDSVAQATAVTSEPTVLTTSERAVTDTPVPSTTLKFPSGSAHNHTSTLANEVQFDATASLSTVDQPVTIPYVDDDTSALPNELGPDATASVTIVGPLTTAAYVDDPTLTLADGATTNMDAMVPSAAVPTDDSETFFTIFPLTISGNVPVDQGKAEDASNLVAPVDNSATRTTLIATNGADAPQSGSRPFDDDAISSVTVLNAEATPEATETTAQLTTESFATKFSTPPFDLDENSVLAFNSGMFGNNMSVTLLDHSPPTATSEALGSATFSQTSGEVLQSTTEGNIVTTVDQLDYTMETTMLTTANMTVTALLHAFVTGPGLEDTAVGFISNNASSSTVGHSPVTEHVTNLSTIATPTTEPKTEASQLMSSSGPTATTVTMIRIAAEAPEETGHMTFSSTPIVSAVTTVAVEDTEKPGKVVFSSTSMAPPPTMSSTAAEDTEETIQVAFSSTTMATPATISSTTTESADETGNNISSSTPMASTVVMSSTAVEETEGTVQVTFSSTSVATPATISSTAAEDTEETSQVTLSSTSTATSATTSFTAAEATNETGNATSSSTAIAINVTMPSTAGEWTEETVEVTFPNTPMVTSSSTAVEGIEETSQVTLSTTPTATNATMSFITVEVAEETGNGTSSSTPVASTITLPSTVVEETEETAQVTFSSTPMITSVTRNSTTAGDTGETGHVTSSSAQTATVTMRDNAAQSSMESMTQFNNASPSENEAHHEASSTEDLASIGYSLTSQSTVPELQHNDAEDTTATTTTAVTRRYKPVYVRRFTPWLITRSSSSSLPVTSSSSPTTSSVRSQPELDTPNAKEASTVESEPNTVQERLYQNNLSLRSLPATSKAITRVPPSDTLVVPQSFFGSSRNALFNRFGRPYCPGCDALLIKLPARFSVPRVPPYIYG